MARPVQWFRWLRLLSIDIALGATATSYYSCSLIGINLPRLFWPVQFLVVLIIYLTDHVADSRFLTHSDFTDRYSFYRNKQKFLIAILFVLFASLITLLFFLSFEIWIYGFVGIGFIIAYLILNQWQNRVKAYRFPRELVIAFFYFYGTCGLPILLKFRFIRIEESLLLAGYFFLILSNVLIYSYYEYSLDHAQRIKTLAVRFGRDNCLKIGISATVIGIFSFLGSLLISTSVLPFSAIGIIISLFYLTIFFKPYYFSLNGRYGVAADMAFFLPGILYFLK
jgi:4-hydroxybenzoate polyprenyltransferase